MLEPARRFGSVLPWRGSRAGGQAVLVGLMVVAFVIVAIVRSTPPGEDPGTRHGGGASGPDGSPAAVTLPVVGLPSVPATAAPSTTLSSPATSSPTRSPASPTPKPSAATPRPGSSVAPTGAGQYTVRSGDTLSGIAVRFGTTVKVLKQLNNIDNVQLIRVGQVLIVP